jgi:hypothetical protein
MEEQKTIQLGGLVYRLEMTNPETGWHKVKNANDTSFWIPDEILKEIAHIQMGLERVEMLNDRFSDRMDELRKKADSQRKSIDYYKSERDSYKRIANKQAKDWEKLMDEFKAYKNHNITHIHNLEEGNSILAMELGSLNDEFSMARRATLLSIGGNVILMLIILIMMVL